MEGEWMNEVTSTKVLPLTYGFEWSTSKDYKNGT